MKIFITGANGQLGSEFQKRLSADGVPFIATDLPELDITNAAAVGCALDAHQPTVLINCAAYNLVDEAEGKRERAFAINAWAVKAMAWACAQRGIVFVHYSTDYVFDGAKGTPYKESDAPNPLGVYAASKLAGENATREFAKEHLLLRLSWVIGPGTQNFLYKLSQWAEKADVLKISSDETSVPTFTPVVVDVTLAALKANLRGLYHLTNSGQASRIELAEAYFEALGVKKELVPVPIASFNLKAKRPENSAMSSAAIQKALGIVIPEWRESLREFVRDKSLKTQDT